MNDEASFRELCKRAVRELAPAAEAGAKRQRELEDEHAKFIAKRDAERKRAAEKALGAKKEQRRKKERDRRAAAKPKCPTCGQPIRKKVAA